MVALDANLLVALDALLTERSVTRAAERLHSSPAATSRTLGRIRRVLGDPVLVRAGQSMVLTPRAEAMRPEVRAVVERCQRLLGPGDAVDPADLSRTFTVQTSDMLVPRLAEGLLAAAAREAPGVRYRFLSEAFEGGPALRDGMVDVEVGVIERGEPETLAESLVTDRFRAAVRVGHPLTVGEVTPERFAAAEHVGVSRRGRVRGPIDDRLAELGLSRTVAAVLPSHTAALVLVAATDLVGLVPATVRPGAVRPPDYASFDIPLRLPPVAIGMAWHPRNDADQGHRWLRARIREMLGTCEGQPNALVDW